jgi:DNA-directed RNA polymerase I, II, and III subunit RPABC2
MPPKKIINPITLKSGDIKVDSSDIDKESQLQSKKQVVITKKKQLELKEDLKEDIKEDIKEDAQEDAKEEPKVDAEVVLKDKKPMSKSKLVKKETKEATPKDATPKDAIPKEDEDMNKEKEKEVLLDASKLSKTKKHTKKIDTNELFNEEDLDYRTVMLNYDFTKNKTLPKITKYEKALLIGKRAKQIEEGANPNVKVLPGQSVIAIAEEELRQRKIPLIIKRPLGNTFEYWKPVDMEVIMD